MICALPFSKILALNLFGDYGLIPKGGVVETNRCNIKSYTQNEARVE